jgi:hypothetical protein
MVAIDRQGGGIQSPGGRKGDGEGACAGTPGELRSYRSARFDGRPELAEALTAELSALLA